MKEERDDIPMEETTYEANTLTNSVRNNMYHLRASPQYVHEINSTSSMVNVLLKRSISNAYRHDLNLKPGWQLSVGGDNI